MSPEQQAAQQAGEFVAKLNEFIIFPTIALLSAVAFFLFLWGAAEYLFNADNEEARRKGVRNITYGIIGLVIMLSAFSILALFASTFGLDDDLDCYRNPEASGCEAVFEVPDSGRPSGGSDGIPPGSSSGGSDGIPPGSSSGGSDGIPPG